MIESVSTSKVIISILIFLVFMGGIGLVLVKYENSIFKTERVITNFKRIFIFVIIISVAALAGYIAVLKFAFSGWSNDPIAKGEDLIVTSLGDEFLAQYATTNFPDYQTHIAIVDTSTKKTIGNLYVESDYVRPNIIVQSNSTNVRCYQFSESLLVYKVDNGQFKGVTIGFIEDEKPEVNADLIVASKVLVDKKEWKWIKACGSFLLKAGDDDMKKTLKRYALGQFSQEELDLNINSEFKKEDIQVFAKQLLEQQ